MFESLDFFQLVSKGGYTIVVLMICSVISVAVAVEKFIVLSKMKNMSKKEIDAIQSAVASSDIKAASEISQKSRTFLGDVLAEGLKNKNGVAVKESVLRKISQKVFSLEKYLSAVGTIGAITPFIGLLGTVVGIMRAFHDLGKYGVGNPSIVSSGIAEALIATAAGLLVAIPSVILYNYFSKRINRIAADVENTAFEILNPLIYGIGNYKPQD
ncbi:MAG: MotA/TolQ/ExbB proton channel family protein [Elusimicrobia bacterium]|nr:MotA/TolQ/ExbB proton channel family protein [Elusimicrobiota bacterium]